MKNIKYAIVLLCIVLMQSCKNNEKTDQCKNIIDIQKNIPDSLYTIPVQLLHYYGVENYKAEYNNRAYDEIYCLKDESNDKISIMYTKDGDNYMIEIKKFREGNKAFYIIWENLSMDTFSMFRDSIIYYSNLNSSIIKNYVPHFNGRAINRNYKRIVIDFGKPVKNLDLFYEIKYIE